MRADCRVTYTRCGSKSWYPSRIRISDMALLGKIISPSYGPDVDWRTQLFYDCLGRIHILNFRNNNMLNFAFFFK